MIPRMCIRPSRACESAGADPRELASVFACTEGDVVISALPRAELRKHGDDGQPGLRGHGVVAAAAGDLLDEVHLPLQVAPEGGHLQHQVFSIHGQGGQMETPQQVQHLLRAELGAQHLVGPGNPEVQPGVLYGRGILIQAPGGHSASAHLAHELGGPLQGMDHPVGVHPPLEPVR